MLSHEVEAQVRQARPRAGPGGRVPPLDCRFGVFEPHQQRRTWAGALHHPGRCGGAHPERPPHRIARLRRQGERYFTDGLRDISGDRRLAILAVCAVEWRGAIADAVVETHDRIVGQTFRSAQRRSDARIQDSRTVLRDTLASFRTLGAALLEAKGDGAPLEEAVAAAGGWQKLEGVVAAAEQLSDTMSADPLAGDRRLWEVAALFHMRDAFRSGDVWLAHSRRYGDVKRALAPIEAAHATARLAVPFEAREWLAERKAGLVEGLDRLADAAHHGRIPGGAIENGELRIGRPASAVPEDVDELVLDLYRRLPEVRITDILLEVDAATGFTDAFTHLRTGAPCKDRIGLLNVLLAEGLNLGLSKMAEASNTHDFFQLSRLSRWHIESEAIDRALAMVIEAQAQLPMARLWGLGLTASSDGQFFPAARQGEAMNLVNARYGSEPGLKAYTHVSDRFGPFATQTIPATVNEAPYILDGLLMTRAGRRIREQYADTGGFTDQVFAVTSLLGYRFIPRIRDLPSKRLHVFEPRRVPKPLIGLTGNKIREDVIVRNWPDILRVAATLASGALPPSQLLRKFSAYPRQHELAVTLREIGRVERTLFIVDWLLDADMQRRANTGLNKGEAHHALKNALRIGRQGEIRDRSSEGQHYRMAGLNLLAAIVIYWNTAHLGEAVRQRKHADLTVEPELLAHISPLGWAHILLTGEYRWPKRR